MLRIHQRSGAPAALCLLALALAAGCNDSGGSPGGTAPTFPRAGAVWRQVSAGQTAVYLETAALADDGTLVLWSIARGDTVLRAQVVSPGTRFTSLKSDCALAIDGSATCWYHDTPPAAYTAAHPLRDWSQDCGITMDGRAICMLADSSPPVALPGDPGLVSVSGRVVGDGDFRACGLGKDGLVYCWSAGASTLSPPTPISPDLHFTAVATGPTHTCAIAVSGDAYCWGANDGDELGVPHTQTGNGCTATPVSCATPQLVRGGHHFVQITVGNAFSCGLDAAGAAWCWGLNMGKVLGVDVAPEDDCRFGGGYDCTATPVAVSGGLTFATLGEAKLYHVCAVTAAGAAYCWGNLRPTGLPGVGVSLRDGQSTPVRIPDPGNAVR